MRRVTVVGCGCRVIGSVTTPRSWPRSAGRSSPSAPASSLEHVGHYSFDPATLPGNVENFMGVAQVPIGLAGPLLINGEHAQGEFFVPLATTEGTLVASYNRGMRLLTECGGVRTTVVDESMQRAPVFVFDDALEARAVRRVGRRALRRRRGRGGVDDERRQAAPRSASTRSGRCATCASTTRRATRPVRT